jgi:hypothetical protein
MYDVANEKDHSGTKSKQMEHISLDPINRIT